MTSCRLRCIHEPSCYPFGVRKNGAKQLDRLKAHGILRYRGSRAGRASKRHIESSAGECQQLFGDLNKIEVIASNLRPIPKCKQTTRPRILREIEIIDASLHHAGVWNARSINNKHGFVNELIASSDFDFFGVVETFHEDRNTPSLIAATPDGYTYMEQARTPTGSGMNLRCYGGVCLFYRRSYVVTVKTDNRFEKFEHITVLMKKPGECFIVVVVYRPGSVRPCAQFFNEFGDLLDTLNLFSCPVYILGDLNIHFDDVTDPDTTSLQYLLTSHGLKQAVQGPTHSRGHTIDVIIIREDMNISSITVTPPSISDHSIVSFSFHTTVNQAKSQLVTKRSWKKVNRTDFMDDLMSSELYSTTSTDPTELFNLYDSTLETLADRHAPYRSFPLPG